MIFGCDICQDVCPWNRFSKGHTEHHFEPSEKLKGMNKTQWDELSQEEYEEIFHESAMQRTGYTGLRRNIEFVKS